VDVTFTMTGGFTGAVVKEIIVAQSRAGIGGGGGGGVGMNPGLGGSGGVGGVGYVIVCSW